MAPEKFEIIVINSLSEMRDFAKKSALTYMVSGGRLLVLLDGPMGVGKTQFTQFFVEELQSNSSNRSNLSKNLRASNSIGSTDSEYPESEVRSPTFAIHNSYSIDQVTVDHFDLFRLKSEDDLESTGFWDFFQNKNGIIVIEWSEKLADFGISENFAQSWTHLKIKFEALDPTAENRRVLRLYR